MPQQINLYTPVQYASPERFTADSMVSALLIVVVLAGGMGGMLAWNMSRASATYNQSLTDQERDIRGLKRALDLARANAAPADTALVKQLQAAQAEVTQREALLATVQHGTVQPGYGHSDRLQLIASSIPPQVWITELKANSDMLEMSGFTLQPAELNDWVKRLAQSPLMQGLQLAAVKVEIASDSLRGVGGAGGSGVPGTTGNVGSAGPVAGGGATDAVGTLGAVSALLATALSGVAPTQEPARVPPPAPDVRLTGVSPGVPVWSFTLVSAQQNGAPVSEGRP